MIPLPALSTVIAVLAGLAGFTAGYTFEHRARIAEVAQIRAYFAQRESAAAIDTSRRIEAAQRAADQAIAARDARIADLDAMTRRLRHELSTATTGRPCLSSTARSLLQQSPAFGIKLPTTTGGPAPADAALAADPGQHASDSSDTDIAGWIIDAASLYEACRARIDALRQWDEVTHDR
jgi:prophage endopeptidase